MIIIDIGTTVAATAIAVRWFAFLLVCRFLAVALRAIAASLWRIASLMTVRSGPLVLGLGLVVFDMVIVIVMIIIIVVIVVIVMVIVVVVVIIVGLVVGPCNNTFAVVRGMVLEVAA